MTPRSKGVIIISLKAVDGGEALGRKVETLDGVISAEFNHLTHKLVVHYDDEVADMERIRSEIEKPLEKRSSGRWKNRRSKGASEVALRKLGSIAVSEPRQRRSTPDK